MRILILLSVLSLLPLSAFAQVYTWRDAQGRVHFSDKAPAGQKAQTVNLPEAAPEPVAPASDEGEQLARQKRLAQALEEERLEKERLKEQAQAEAEKKAQYCERFANRLSRMDAASRLYSENQDGTLSYWNEEDSDRVRAETHARYQTECGES